MKIIILVIENLQIQDLCEATVSEATVSEATVSEAKAKETVKATTDVVVLQTVVTVQQCVHLPKNTHKGVPKKRLGLL